MTISPTPALYVYFTLASYEYNLDLAHYLISYHFLMN